MISRWPYRNGFEWIISERAYMRYSLFFLVLTMVIVTEEAFDLFMLFKVHGTEFRRK